MEYINTISHQVFQRDFRYVLLQHECAPHEEEHVHVPYNMSVIYNIFSFLPSFRSNKWKNSTGWFVQFLNVNILLTTASFNIFVSISAATVISQQLELWRPTSSWKSTQCRWPTSPWSKSQPSECQQSCLWQQSDWQHEPSSSHRLSTQHAWNHRHSTTRPTTTTWKRGGFAPQQNSTKPWRMWQQNRSRGSMGQHSCEFWQGDPQQEPNTGCNNSLYHYTEGHFTTNSGQMILSSFTVNKGQQLVRLGNKSINLFNRAYLMPQLQVEAGSTIKFTTDELASTQYWVLESNNDQSIMSRIATTLSWSNGYLWTYNYVFPTSLVVDDNSDHWKALLQAVEYAGATCINKLPQECQRIWTLLTDASNYQPLRQLQLAGTKAPERLRGNSQVIEWVNNTFTWEEYALGFNEYHNKMSDDEDNMMQQGEWERHQQRVELRSPWCHKASKQQSWWVQQDLPQLRVESWGQQHHQQ